MSLDDLPLYGRVTGVLGSVGGLLDLLLSGGDVVLSVAWALLSQADQLVPFLLTVERLSARVPWLSVPNMDQLIVAVLTVSLTYTVLRWGRNVLRSKRET